MKNQKTKPTKIILLLSVFSVFAVLLFTVGSSPINGQNMDTAGDNPLLKPYGTPFDVPPFDKIKPEHFMPAFMEGIRLQKLEIEAIVNNPEPPTFANTIEAYVNQGFLLDSVDNVFNTFRGSMNNEKIQKISEEISPILSRADDEIVLNEKLFQRIKAVYDMKDKLTTLTEEQRMMLEKIYKSFTRNGANLSPENKNHLKALNEELSGLALKFSTNLLKEENKYMLVIDKKEDLAGLSQNLIDGAAETAAERGLKDKWVFTLQRSSIFPFLQYSQKRELREKIYKAYMSKCNNGDNLDNKEILSKIITLRVEKAKLLGYERYADYVLELNMAKNPANVYEFLMKLWKPALETARKEANEYQSLINKEGGKFKLEPWDWFYYAEKMRKAKYDLDDEEIRPYFSIDNVRQGAFYVANKLYGIKFVERKDFPKYHQDVKVFEVQEADGTPLGILYNDPFPRIGKRSGAWASAVRKEYHQDGKRVIPVVTNTLNLSKPIGDKPALLVFSEVTTLFHEFGHALHHLLSNCDYRMLSGSAVPRDFVELPSQFMENFATEEAVIKVYAKHYKTGEVIPNVLLKKIIKSALFNKGFENVEYLAASFLDMDYHTVKDVTPRDIEKFENESLSKINMMPEIVTRYRSTYFGHSATGSYAAGYYSYGWARILDADAFEAFKETSLFDQKAAKAFRTNILEKGGSADPMVLYKRFRGAEPKIEPLLKREGFLQEPKKKKK